MAPKMSMRLRGIRKGRQWFLSVATSERFHGIVPPLYSIPSHQGSNIYFYHMLVGSAFSNGKLYLRVTSWTPLHMISYFRNNMESFQMSQTKFKLLLQILYLEVLFSKRNFYLCLNRTLFVISHIFTAFSGTCCILHLHMIRHNW